MEQLKIVPDPPQAGQDAEIGYSGGTPGSEVEIEVTITLTDGSKQSSKHKLKLDAQGEGSFTIQIPQDGDAFLVEDMTGSADDLAGPIT